MGCGVFVGLGDSGSLVMGDADLLRMRVVCGLVWVFGFVIFYWVVGRRSWIVGSGK